MKNEGKESSIKIRNSHFLEGSTVNGGRAVVLIEIKTGEERKFESSRKCAMFLGVHPNEVGFVLTGKRKTIKGRRYKVRYASDVAHRPSLANAKCLPSKFNERIGKG